MVSTCSCIPHQDRQIGKSRWALSGDGVVSLDSVAHNPTSAMTDLAFWSPPPCLDVKPLEFQAPLSEHTSEYEIPATPKAGIRHLGTRNRDSESRLGNLVVGNRRPRIRTPQIGNRARRSQLAWTPDCGRSKSAAPSQTRASHSCWPRMSFGTFYTHKVSTTPQAKPHD